MSEIVLAGFVLVMIVTVTTVGTGAMVVGRLRRANAVAERVDTGAPLRWLVVPVSSALLHRRLRSALVMVRAACPPRPSVRGRWWRRPGPETSRLHDLVASLESCALALDRDLVTAARLRGRRRTQVLLATARHVVTVEHLAARLVALANTPSPLAAPPAADALAGLHDEVTALEAARLELARIEAAIVVPSSGSFATR